MFIAIYCILPLQVVVLIIVPGVELQIKELLKSRAGWKVRFA